MGRVTYKIKTILFWVIPQRIYQWIDMGRLFGISLPLKAYPHDADQYLNCIRSNKSISTPTINAELGNLLKRRRVNINIFPPKWWEKFYEAASRPDDTQGLRLQQELIDEVKNLNFDIFYFWQLLHFYSIAIGLGLFTVAFHLREKSVEKLEWDLKNDLRINNYSLIRGLAVLFERQKTGEFKYTYNKYKSRLNPKFDKLIREFYSVFDDYSFLKKNLETISQPKEKDSFDEFIQDRSCCIVGPADTQSDDSKEINEFDVIIRCNYREYLKGLDPKVKGTRTDVSYILSHQAEELYKQENYNWPLDIQWVVFRTSKIRKKIADKINKYYIVQNKNGPIKNSRFIKNFNPIFFNGTFNAVPYISHDVLSRNPLKLKVFHADLMLTANRAKGYYSDGSEIGIERKKIFLRGCYRNHDPLTQFFFFQNLSKSSNVKGDERLNEVLSMEPYEYMQALQSKYGVVGRI